MFESPHRYYFNSPALQKPVVELPTLNSVKPFTGVAQRKRARLITSRTPDRNGSPVFIIISHRCIKALEHFNTSLAQWQSARLITWRSVDQNPQEASFQFAWFAEPGRRAADVKLSQTLYRCGAAAAREAHNLEDT